MTTILFILLCGEKDNSAFFDLFNYSELQNL